VTPIDVFAIGGQSNAVGYGTGGPPIPPGVAWQWWAGALTALTGDPVGGSSGSAWPAFALRWRVITGRAICFVPCAVSGSAQTAAADTGAGNWSGTGALFNAMLGSVADALAALIAADFQPLFRGMIWTQGEADAVAIAGGLQTSVDYLAELIAMADRFHDEFALATLFLVETGTRSGSSDGPYAAIRIAQETAPAGRADVAMVHFTASEFVDAGWLAPGSDIHWSQAGLDHVGRFSAEAIASGAAFNKQWARMVAAKTTGGALPWVQLIVGTTGKIYFGAGLNFIASGSGSPNAVVAAPVGSIFLRRDGGPSTTLYVKESGTGTTGWNAK
jgi:hypothetical protein